MSIKQIVISAVVLIIIGMTCLYYPVIFMKLFFVGGKEIQVEKSDYIDFKFSNGESLSFRKSTKSDNQRNDESSMGIEVSSGVTTTTTRWDGTITVENSRDKDKERISSIQSIISQELQLDKDHNFNKAPFREHRILSETDNTIEVLISNNPQNPEENYKVQFYSLRLEMRSGKALELKEIY